MVGLAMLIVVLQPSALLAAHEHIAGVEDHRHVAVADADPDANGASAGVIDGQHVTPDHDAARTALAPVLVAALLVATVIMAVPDVRVGMPVASMPLPDPPLLRSVVLRI